MSRAQALTLLVALILAGLALRLHRLDYFSFRGDEAFTVINWVSQPLLETLQGEIPLKDPQPPLTFAIFRGWALLFGTGEWMMRLLPALLSLVGIAAMYALAHHIGGRGAGLLAATLSLLHPFLVWHAQDAKPYAVWVAVSTCAAWLGLRALKRDRLPDWLLYVVIATLAAYLYYLELFLLLALNLYVLPSFRSRGRTLRRWLLAQLGIGLLLAPWFLQERLLLGSDYGGTTGSLDPLRLFTWILPSLQFGRSLPLDLLERSALLVICALLAGLWFMARRRGQLALFAGLGAFLPPLLLALTSLRLGVFTPRYVLASIPACILLLVELGGGLWRRAWPARILTIAIFSSWLALMLLSLGNAWNNPAFAKAPDWRGLVNYLDKEARPGDLIIQAAADEAFTLYHADARDSLRLPANPRQELSEIHARLEAAITTYDSIWLVASPPPGWPNRQVAADWLATHMQLVRETQIGALPVRQYRTWQVHQHELAAAPLAIFGDVTGLAALNLGRAPDALHVELVWRVRGPAAVKLKGFVHLYGAPRPDSGSTLWTQDDQFIQGGRVDSRNWSQGDLLRDVYALPLKGVPPGSYDLRVGLYDPDSGARVLLANGAEVYLAGPVDLSAPTG